MSPGEIISMIGVSVVAMSAIITAVALVVTIREDVRQLKLRMSQVEEEQRQVLELHHAIQRSLDRIDERLKYLPCVLPRGECPDDDPGIGGVVRT